jgi:hypothetical protein
MAVETTTPTITGDGTYPIEISAPWAVNHHSSNFSSGILNDELKAAPTRDGSALYLTHVTMGIVENTSRVLVDANLDLLDGNGESVFGPVQFVTDGTTVFSKDFSKPLKITDKKALDVSGRCATTGYQAACWVYVEGFTGDKPLG